MKLEGLTLDARKRLARIDSDNGDLPLVLLARTNDEREITYISSELPTAVRDELALQVNQSNIGEPEKLLDFLRARGFPVKLGHYRTYIFPEEYAQVKPEGVKRFDKEAPAVQVFGMGGLGEDVYAIEENGIILSACVSSRQNEESAEAWVYTQPEHRSRGLGQRVVMAWAGALIKAGLTPFYSHRIENAASARLACALELIPVFDEFGIEREDS